MPEAHKNRGFIFEELGKPDEAYVQYKKAAEYEGFTDEKVMTEKIDATKTKMLKMHENKLKDHFDETRKLLALSSLPEEDKGSAQIILSHLESIQNVIPKIEQLKDIAKRIGFEVPRHIFKGCREIAEDYFNKTFEIATQKYPGLAQSDKLWDKLDILHKRNVINSYIRGLVSLIWGVGGKAGHPSDNPWVDTLKIEDAEVVVAATVRFLSWYIENYSRE